MNKDKDKISDDQVDQIVEKGELTEEDVELLADWVTQTFEELDQ